MSFIYTLFLYGFIGSAIVFLCDFFCFAFTFIRAFLLLTNLIVFLFIIIFRSDFSSSESKNVKVFYLYSVVGSVSPHKTICGRSYDFQWIHHQNSFLSCRDFKNNLQIFNMYRVRHIFYQFTFFQLLGTCSGYSNWHKWSYFLSKNSK